MPFNREQFIAAATAGKVEQLQEQLNQQDIDIRAKLKEVVQGDLTIAEEAFVAATQNMTADKAKDYLDVLAILFRRLNEDERKKIKESDRFRLTTEQLAIKVDGKPLVRIAAEEIDDNRSYCEVVEFLLNKGAAVQDLADIKLPFNNEELPLPVYLSRVRYANYINLLGVLVEKGIELSDPLPVFRALAVRQQWPGVEAILRRNLLDLRQHGSVMLYVVVNGGGWIIAQRFLQQGVRYQAQSNPAPEKNILKVALNAANNRPQNEANADSDQTTMVTVIDSLFKTATPAERQEALQHAKELKRLPASVNSIINDYFDITAFESAVMRQNLPAIAAQLNRKSDVDVNVHLSSCGNAKAWMLNNNNVKGLEILIKAGAKLDPEGDLFAAAKDDRLDVFKFIYESKPVSMDLQQRLLLQVIKTGQLKVAQYLIIEKGIKPLPPIQELAQDIIAAAKQYATHGQAVHLDKINQRYEPNSASSLEASNHQLAIAKLILPLAESVFNPDVFLNAAYNGNVAVMQAELLKNSKDINCRLLPDGRSALHLVIQNEALDAAKKLEVVQFLLANDADPNTKDADANTPLREVVRGNYAGIVAALLDKGANPNIENKDHSTLENYSRDLKDEAVEVRLKQALASMPRVPYELPMFNRKELEYKCLSLKDPQKVREALQKPGVDLYWVSQMAPYTPLLLQIVEGWRNAAYGDAAKLYEIIQILIEHGAVPTQADQKGITAITVLDFSGGYQSDADKQKLKKLLNENKEAALAKRKAWEQEQKRIAEEREAAKQAFEERLKREITEANDKQKLPAKLTVVDKTPVPDTKAMVKSPAEEQSTASSTVWKVLGLIALGLLGVGLIGIGVASFGIIPNVTLATIGLGIVTSQMGIASLILGALAVSTTVVMSAWMVLSNDELPGVEKQPLLQPEKPAKQSVAVATSVADVIRTTSHPANVFSSKAATGQPESGQTYKKLVPTAQL